MFRLHTNCSRVNSRSARGPHSVLDKLPTRRLFRSPIERGSEGRLNLGFGRRLPVFDLFLIAAQVLFWSNCVPSSGDTPEIPSCSDVPLSATPRARLSTGHGVRHVPQAAFLPAQATFFAQNGTLEICPTTKMSHPAKRPEEAPKKKDSFQPWRWVIKATGSGEVAEEGWGLWN